MKWLLGKLGWQQYLIITLATTLAAMSYRADLMARRARDAGIQTENLLAALDSTRLVGDQYRRRAAQAELERDELAQELDERPVLVTTVTLDPEPVSTDTLSLAATSATDTLRFEHIDDLLTAEITVGLAVPQWAVLKYDLQPIRLTVGARCGPANDVGVRTALITASAEGRTVDVERAQVDPDLCNPVDSRDHGGGFGSFIKGIGVGVFGVLTYISVIS